MKKISSKISSIFAITLMMTTFNVWAVEPEYKIIIKDHKFSPQNLEIPANKKVKLIIENQDDTAEEFESFDLNREKIVKGKKSIVVFVGPLKSGTYKYFGEFHSKTAQGTIAAK